MKAIAVLTFVLLFVVPPAFLCLVLLYKLVRRIRCGPNALRIKPKAHFFTLLSVIWIPFSAAGFSLFSASRELPTASEAWKPALILCGLHASFIVLAVVF
ncbi:MAG: hypothetical protein ABSD58_04115 [Verrucomicrobiia bacterium]|jgi:uncharacterized SAM-binding protein YcdF (DUF218 family)